VKLIKKKYPTDETELDFASLGKSKELLDRIEFSSPLDVAIQMFGPFLQYYTKSISHSSPVRINAFALMMSSQKQLSQPTLPTCLTEHTNKDKLHNSILIFFKSKGLLLSASIAHSTGKAFAKSLTDCLWTIDGHYDSLKRQLCPVPEVFLSICWF